MPARWCACSTVARGCSYGLNGGWIEERSCPSLDASPRRHSDLLVTGGPSTVFGIHCAGRTADHTPVGPAAITPENRLRRLRAARAPAQDPGGSQSCGPGYRRRACAEPQGDDFLFESGQDLSIGYDRRDGHSVRPVSGMRASACTSRPRRPRSCSPPGRAGIGPVVDDANSRTTTNRCRAGRGPRR